MKTKHSKFNEEDAKYAYVILRRGPRPRSSDATDSLETKAYEWPRLIQPPLKKHGHVVMDTCASSGMIIIKDGHMNECIYSLSFRSN